MAASGYSAVLITPTGNLSGMDEHVEQSRAEHRDELRRILQDKLKEVWRESTFIRRHAEHMDLDELEHLNDLANEMLKLHPPGQCKADHQREGADYVPWGKRR
jgi:hypothetical protein